MSNGFKRFRARIDGFDICVEGSDLTHGNDWQYVDLLKAEENRDRGQAILEALYRAGYLVDEDKVEAGATELRLRRLPAQAVA